MAPLSEYVIMASIQSATESVVGSGNAFHGVTAFQRSMSHARNCTSRAFNVESSIFTILPWGWSREIITFATWPTLPSSSREITATSTLGKFEMGGAGKTHDGFVVSGHNSLELCITSLRRGGRHYWHEGQNADSGDDDRLFHHAGTLFLARC